MKKNLKLFGALAALFVLIWFARPWERQPRQLEAYDRKIDSLERVAARFNYEAAEAWLAMKEAKAQADLAAVRVDSLNRSIQGLKKKHGQRIEVLRSQPPDSVMTTTLAMAECDSCCEVGFQMQLVSEEQAAEIIDLRAAIDNCEEAYAKKDTAEQVKSSALNACADKNDALEKQAKTSKWVQRGLILLFITSLFF